MRGTLAVECEFLLITLMFWEYVMCVLGLSSFYAFSTCVHSKDM